jgi:hypothetical protein
MSPARPSLLPVAAFVSLLVLLLGATGLFALHHTNEKTAADLARLDAAEDALLLTVRARAAFKTQVQEWKNILLRGHDPADLARYRAGFEAEERITREALEQLVQSPPDTTFETGQLPFPLPTLLAEHARLSEAYRAALAAHDLAASRDAGFAIDRAVRGLDRPLSDKLDHLAIAMERIAATELRALAERAAARYEVLRRITWIVASFAVLASLWLCFRATRLAP